MRKIEKKSINVDNTVLRARIDQARLQPNSPPFPSCECPLDSRPNLLSPDRGDPMNRQKSIRPDTFKVPASAIVRGLRTQRQQIAALARRSRTLQTRGKCLVTQANSLAERIEGAGKNLVSTYHMTQRALAGLRQLRTGRQDGILSRSHSLNERVLEDAPDMVEALQQAAVILNMEFADTQGSGRETLVKCEKVLQRARSVSTMELPLY